MIIGKEINSIYNKNERERMKEKKRMKNQSNEKRRQEDCPWSRSDYHTEYNKILAQYKVQSCLEHIQGTSLLDIACGDGLITAQFKPYFSRVVGVDASSVHLAAARKRLPDVEFHESLIEELNLSQKFDTILMLDLLEHVIDPIIVLKKAASFLKNDGVLIVHVPNTNAVNRKIAVLMGTLKSCDELSPFDIEVAGHRRSYTLESLKEDIKNAGLQVTETGGIFYKMLSTPQMDWFLKKGLWEEGGHGWGRVGAEKEKDWSWEFCRACYEYGKGHPEECNIIYVCAKKNISKGLVEE